MIRSFLKRALKITWQNPGFWLLGFLMTFSFLSINEFVIIFASPTFFTSDQLIGGDSLNNLPFKIDNLLVIIILFIFIFLFFLSAFTETLFIFFIKKKEWNNGSGLLNLALKFSKKTLFFRLISLLIIIALWSLALFLIKNLAIASTLTSLLIFALTSLVVIIVLFITRYSIFYSILERNNFSLSVKNASIFFARNWLASLKISFILFLISIIYGFLGFYIINGGILTYPLRLFNFVFNILLKLPIFWLGWVFTAIIALIIQIILGGFIIALQTSTWLLFFKQQAENVNKNP